MKRIRDMEPSWTKAFLHLLQLGTRYIYPNTQTPAPKSMKYYPTIYYAPFPQFLFFFFYSIWALLSISFPRLFSSSRFLFFTKLIHLQSIISCKFGMPNAECNINRKGNSIYEYEQFSLNMHRNFRYSKSINRYISVIWHGIFQYLLYSNFPYESDVRWPKKKENNSNTKCTPPNDLCYIRHLISFGENSWIRTDRFVNRKRNCTQFVDPGSVSKSKSRSGLASRSGTHITFSIGNFFCFSLKKRRGEKLKILIKRRKIWNCARKPNTLLNLITFIQCQTFVPNKYVIISLSSSFIFIFIQNSNTKWKRFIM